MGHSPPKCTCNGNQTHSSKYMIQLECVHDMDENVTHPFPLLEPLFTLTHMPKPNLRKILLSKQNVFVFENVQPSFGKIYWTTLRGELLGNSPKQSWVRLRDELLDNSPKQFFGKSSLKFLSQAFSFFIFFHVMHSYLLF